MLYFQPYDFALRESKDSTTEQGFTVEGTFFLCLSLI